MYIYIYVYWNTPVNIYTCPIGKHISTYLSHIDTLSLFVLISAQGTSNTAINTGGHSARLGEEALIIQIILKSMTN